MNLDILKELGILIFLISYGLVAGVSLSVGSLLVKRLKFATKFLLEVALGSALCLVFWLAMYLIDGGKIMAVHVLLAVMFGFLFYRGCESVVKKIKIKRKEKEKSTEKAGEN